MARRISLIVNPRAGGGRAAAALPVVEAALSGRGVAWHVEATRSLDHARELARAARDGGEVAVTLSGDGLIGAVAGELHGTDGVLGILPGGRGNDFARVLGIPREPAEACDVIAEGVERRVDVGDVDGRPFIGIASCGFDSEANRIANETTVVKGNLVYAYGALRALAEWKPARFELELDGRERVAFSGYSVACANSKAYGGGMFIAPDAELDDGQLDVVMSGRGSKRRFLYNLPKVFEGTHVQSPSVRIVRAAEVRVAADRPFTMYADGDPIAELPATVRVHARALRVLVPA
ncbi:MAG: diacylglycerol kinase family lipid kinase [Actinomycetota bacterium]|nr:diacylglycerol kinase family lipid kinase [Actinomycetota bacterium]